MDWFINIQSMEELRAKYKELCKKHHPDLGGDTETMQDINSQYAVYSVKLQNHSCPDIEDELLQKIQEISNLPNILIEVCGVWIWVSGDTKAVRHELRLAGFFFAPKKKIWFWRPKTAKCYFNSSEMSLEEIRLKYGSRKEGRATPTLSKNQ